MNSRASIVVLLLLSACWPAKRSEEIVRPAPASRPVSAAKASAVPDDTPLPKTTCEADSAEEGGYQPELHKVMLAGAQVEHPFCTSKTGFAVAFRQCVEKQKTHRVKLHIETERPENWCDVDVTTLEWNKHRWIKLSTTTVEGNKISSILHVYEEKDGFVRPVYAGWIGESAVCSKDPPKDRATSPELLALAPSMPPQIRDFFCQ